MCKLVISRGTRAGQLGNFFQCDTICIGTGQRIKQWLVWATSYQFKVVFTGMYKSGSNFFQEYKSSVWQVVGYFFCTPEEPDLMFCALLVELVMDNRDPVIGGSLDVIVTMQRYICTSHLH